MKISSLISITLPFAVVPEAVRGRRAQDMPSTSFMQNFLKCFEEIGEDQCIMTEEKIEEAQQAWGEGIVKIASAYSEDPESDSYKEIAKDHIDTLYAYEMGPVSFKPTLASEYQFRPSFDEALSYFVKGMYEEDSGFAIKGWTDVRFENNNVFTHGDVGSAMGNYFFTTPAGDEVKVEYSFGYLMDGECNPKINLHHSSLPYNPPITEEQVRKAQDAWGQGIVDISAAYTADPESDTYKEKAEDLINTLYGYEQGPVHFKPTLASEYQFRPTFDEALSYFVKGMYEEDTGFAIKGWTDVRFESLGVVTDGQVATDMGNYYFTDPNGDEVKVEYSFGYRLDSDGHPRIYLHHSSLPYEP